MPDGEELKGNSGTRTTGGKIGHKYIQPEDACYPLSSESLPPAVGCSHQGNLGGLRVDLASTE